MIPNGRLLLTHSNFSGFDRKQNRTGQCYPPLATLYAASVLRQEGLEFRFFDSMFAGGPDDLVPELKKEPPCMLVIYEDLFSYFVKMCLSNMREASFNLIGHGKDSGALVAVCSPDAMDNPGLYLERGADFILNGEGEHTLEELAVRIIRNPDGEYGDIRGITWEKDGAVHVNPPREPAADPDEFPFPAWDLIDMEKYSSAWRKKNGYFPLNMVTTRGCPYSCRWCAKPVFGNRYSCRSPKNVVDEMSLLADLYHPDRIWFSDDIFGLKPGWIGEFEGLVSERRLTLPFTIQSRADLITDRKTVGELAGAGCDNIWLGVESGSQKILDAMQKGITVEQVRNSSALLREAGIRQSFFLQLGYPGESRDDVSKTILLLRDLMPDDIGISVTYPLPGTRFYESVRNDIRSKTNWNDSDDLAPIFKSTFPPSYYKPLHRYIHKDFRFRQSVSWLLSGLAKPASLDRRQARRILLMPYYLVFSMIYKLILISKEHGTRESV